MHESMEDGSGPILYCTGSLFLVLWAARMRLTWRAGRADRGGLEGAQLAQQDFACCACCAPHSQSSCTASHLAPPAEPGCPAQHTKLAGQRVPRHQSVQAPQ